MSTHWIVRAKPRPHAQLRLFCLPHAGGGAASFHPWADLLPPDIELCACQLPGREGRLNEPAIDRLGPLVDALVIHTEALRDRPFALFGHSMGALIAFELSRALRRRGATLPKCLIVSGRRAPSRTPGSEPTLHTMSDADFVSELMRRYNGIPKVVLQEPELLRLFTPCLKADFAVFETYVYAPEPPLECRLAVYGGEEDPQVADDQVAEWARLARDWAGLRRFPGGHFYHQDQRAAVLQAMVEDLRRVPA
jgi:medium-chain acyl-[acyl-carrier-protein] hydrolase